MSQKYLRVEMLDGSQYKVPLELIAMHRALYYAEKKNILIEEALNKETLPLFKKSPKEIIKWAKEHMEWEDVAESAFKCKESICNFEDGWLTGNMEII